MQAKKIALTGKVFVQIFFLWQLSRREGHINPEVEVLGPEKRTTSAAVL